MWITFWSPSSSVFSCTLQRKCQTVTFALLMAQAALCKRSALIQESADQPLASFSSPTRPWWFIQLALTPAAVLGTGCCLFPSRPGRPAPSPFWTRWCHPEADDKAPCCWARCGRYPLELCSSAGRGKRRQWGRKVKERQPSSGHRWFLAPKPTRVVRRTPSVLSKVLSVLSSYLSARSLPPPPPLPLPPG